MSRRHQRRPSLHDIERERFAAEVIRFHQSLIPLKVALQPSSAQYQALSRLFDQLIEANVAVCGEEPEWCQIKGGRMPGEPIDR